MASDCPRWQVEAEAANWKMLSEVFYQAQGPSGFCKLKKEQWRAIQ